MECFPSRLELFIPVSPVDFCLPFTSLGFTVAERKVTGLDRGKKKKEIPPLDLGGFGILRWRHWLLLLSIGINIAPGPNLRCPIGSALLLPEASKGSIAGLSSPVPVFGRLHPRFPAPPS